MSNVSPQLKHMGFSMRAVKVLLFTLLCLIGPPAPAAASDVGVILMHGKWDRPPTAVSVLGRQLEAEGYKVATPLMPWAGSRLYDVPYSQAIVEIDAAARELRGRGAKYIIVGGLSFGANAALAYAASGKPVDAVFALSPGHTPYGGGLRRAVASSVTKAKSMIDSGTGGETAWFEDRNQGEAKQVKARADSYYSYFDPDGLSSMPKSAAAIAGAAPLFMAVGTSDPISQVAEESIFNRAPKNEKSIYTAVAADHVGITSVIGPSLIHWLQSLGY